MTTITILGLGEAGRLYARGLREAGAYVRGYDPHHELGDPDVAQFADLDDALAGAEVVISLVGGAAAASVARDALPAMASSAVYADLNTASPALKQEIEAFAVAHGVAMADVAVLAPVPRAGHRTELIASGEGARMFAERLGPFGVPVEVLDAGAGAAARLRLLRSVFMKGLAALVIESVGAARAIGAEEWLREQLAQELGVNGRERVDRLVEGTHRHAARREVEVRAAMAEIEASGQPADMTRATLSWLRRIADAQKG
ncbi:NAD(P)-dependent oxidoreductase [Microbacterium pumilum]|uniref:NAD(P)-dependent oxidoreductase n=1 Tax=Microbacterium pumilum TaxID=344165 RepID=A0ABN2RRC4_9MICO